MLQDAALIALDACLGLALAVGLFSQHAPIVVIMLGAIAGMLPDPLQFVHSLHPHEPLATLQRFHWWVHSKRKLIGRLVLVRRSFSRRWWSGPHPRCVKRLK